VRQVEFTDSIPKSPAGKILRRLLAERDASLTQRDASAGGQAGPGENGHGN
jgi:acyl-coenzyme A synthetase/AMP-(fatty) acid ligase